MKKSFTGFSVAALVLILSGCATNTLQDQASAENLQQPSSLVASSVASSQVEASKPASKKHTVNFEQGTSDDIPEGTDIVIRSGKDKTIHEYRINGFLYSIKVIPKIGKPYYLVAVDTVGNFTRSNRPQMLIPSWKILEWQ